MRYPVDTETCYTLSTTGDIAQKFFELMKDDELETLISQGICFDKDGKFEVLDEVSHMYTDSMMEHCKALHGADYVECGQILALPTSSIQKQLPSIVQAPQLELKPLPAHLNRWSALFVILYPTHLLFLGSLRLFILL
ncbi:hypothetical protein POM88_040620 [Heracleum sosnowskyi]|uniref:Uncharacterized protein n=1 Tax=Heracleum sosnowskyi TaxID=360622 RepID=A0AAD8M9Y8_9APIA|nr:hypothetical protein POM88_040620 [Heracleum sosnowskyi]